MKKVLIIGAGYAGRSIAQRLKAHAAVTIVEEKERVWNRELFFPWLAKKATDKEFIIDPARFCAQEKLPYVAARVEKIYPLKKEIGLSTKERLGYDDLIIAAGSTAVKKHECGGDAKQGVFYLGQGDPKELSRLLNEATYVVVEARTYLGITAAAILQRTLPEKETKVVLTNPTLRAVWEQHFPDDRLQAYDDEINECIGEGMVKAVRIKNNKVLAADIVLFDNGLFPQTQQFEQSGLFTFQQNALAVNDSLSTPLEHIWALGDVINAQLSDDTILLRGTGGIGRQADRLAHALIPEEGSLNQLPPQPLSEEEMLRYIKETILTALP